MPLKVSYSGVRGIFGDSLTPDVARHFAFCFGLFLRKRFESPVILLGRDTRESGPILKEAVIDGLRGIPCKVLDLGILPSPSLQFGMEYWKASGGIIVTASHNPHQWNGFKFLLGPDNTVLDAAETQELFDLYSQTPPLESPERGLPEIASREGEAQRAHVEKVLQLVDVNLIRSQGFRVAMDTGGGAGRESMRHLLGELGCAVHEVDSHRESEPVPENLGELCRDVTAGKCHIGAAQDLDADRLALVSEKGEAIGEDFTLCFAMLHLLRRHREESPLVVVNSSTTHVIANLVEQYGAEMVETRVGEVNLSRTLISYENLGRRVFGGEGNGGVIYPPVIYGRDSLIALALVLELMATTGKTVSQLKDDLPRYHLCKAKFARTDESALDRLLEELEGRYPSSWVSHLDGLKVSLPDGSWFQIRPSNTEPIVRITVESPEREWASATFEELRASFA